jgi:hypothetical protein
LIQFAKLLDTRSTPNATIFNERLFKEVNVEEMARSWSICLNIDDWDTWGTTRGKNCYLYRPRVDGRWTLIPWDKDLIFGNVAGLGIVQGNHAEVARVLNSPSGRRVYYNILSDMLGSFYNANYVNLFFAEFAKAFPAGSVGSYSRGASFVQSRSATIRASLGSATVNFAITTPAAEEVSQDPLTIVVKGNAAYGIWYIQLDGTKQPTMLLSHEDGSLTWSGTRWTTKALDLLPGRNSLTFTALNLDGVILGSDVLHVTVGETPFLRGDSDLNGVVELTDGVVILNHLFQGIPAPGCDDRLDVDDSGVLDLTDAVYLLRYLFQGGDVIPAPYPEPGTDPTPDALPACTGS